MLRISFAGCLFACIVCQAVFSSAGEPAPGTEIVFSGDSAVMVWVPSGEFIMGLEKPEADRIAHDLGYKDADALWAWETYPKRKMNVKGFFIDKYEVSVERWKLFVLANNDRHSSHEVTQWFDCPDSQQLPAGDIAWGHAIKYCAWAGKKLPTEAQWEKASRGTDGRLYPWGNEKPSPERGNFGGSLGDKEHQAFFYQKTGSYPKGASPYGAMDMLGNQYEWTMEFFEPYPDNPHAEKMKDYTGGKMIVLRGGSWYHGRVGFYSAKRFGFWPHETYYHVGFRTVWEPHDGYFESEQFKRDSESAKRK